MLITFANSLNPDQDRHSVSPDLDPKWFDTLIVFLKQFFQNINFEKKSLHSDKDKSISIISASKYKMYESFKKLSMKKKTPQTLKRYLASCLDLLLDDQCLKAK